MSALRFSLSLATGLLLATAASAEEARGVLVRVNSDKKELQLEVRGPGRGTVLTLAVDAKTRILMGGQPVELSDLTPGRRIRVSFEQRDGKPVVQTIRAFGLRPPPARPQPKSDLPMPRKDGDGISGTLQRVALTDRELVVIGPGAKGPRTETTFAVPEGTLITKDGKAFAFDSLKEGETVTVRAAPGKGRLTALSVQVGQVSAASAQAMPAKPPRREIIPRLRKALQIADELLQEIERQREGGPDRP
jgi:hypothetical protein